MKGKLSPGRQDFLFSLLLHIPPSQNGDSADGDALAGHDVREPRGCPPWSLSYEEAPSYEDALAAYVSTPFVTREQFFRAGVLENPSSLVGRSYPLRRMTSLISVDMSLWMGQSHIVGGEPPPPPSSHINCLELSRVLKVLTYFLSLMKGTHGSESRQHSCIHESPRRCVLFQAAGISWEPPDMVSRKPTLYQRSLQT